LGPLETANLNHWTIVRIRQILPVIS
jgi:hypothetical protein